MLAPALAYPPTGCQRLARAPDSLDLDDRVMMSLQPGDGLLHRWAPHQSVRVEAAAQQQPE